MEALRARALDWLADFRRSDEGLALPARVREQLEFAARILVLKILEHGWTWRDDPARALESLSSDDVTQLLMKALPRSCVTSDPHGLVDGLTAFLIWCAKVGRVADRSVEYTCRKLRRESCEAMDDEARWEASKTVAQKAMSRGLDIRDIAQLEEQATLLGFGDWWAAEFLPPDSSYVGHGVCAWMRDEEWPDAP